MEYVNAMYKYDSCEQKDASFFKECANDLILLMAPFAPHFAEEMWETLGKKYSVFDQSYPVCDESALIQESSEYAVQVNSKIKTKLHIPAGLSEDEIRTIALADDAVRPLVEGKPVKKFIVVPNQAGQYHRLTVFIESKKAAAVIDRSRFLQRDPLSYLFNQSIERRMAEVVKKIHFLQFLLLFVVGREVDHKIKYRL